MPLSSFKLGRNFRQNFVKNSGLANLLFLPYLEPANWFDHQNRIILLPKK